ncbi:hypothetical protein HDU93_009218 [Gonapodya sp. JEL0774]|nr:hypothetical protein HDU93_009218 [Gonapodya sp. JEL0774]
MSSPPLQKSFFPLSIPTALASASAHPDSLLSTASQLVLAAANDPFLAYVQEHGRLERVVKDTQETIDRFKSVGKDAMPLFGLFVGVKDVIHVSHLPTLANSQFADSELHSPGDVTEAPFVTRLKELGAVVLGKVKTTEFAVFTPADTRNPWDASRTPGGSSSGSAAAVALGLAHLTLGTQTASSTVRPAAFCGVVAIKPTFDRIPKGGWCALAEGADTVGLFTRDVGGLRVVMERACQDWHAPLHTTTLSLLRTPSVSVSKPRLILPTGSYMDLLKHPGARAQWDNEVLPAVGKVFQLVHVEIFKPGEMEKMVETHWDIIRIETYLEHSSNGGAGLNLYPSHSSRYSPAFLALLQSGEHLYTTDPGRLRRARASRLHYRLHVASLLTAHGSLAILCPTAADGPAPLSLEKTGDPAMGTVWTHPGVPAVQVPCGAVGGMPVGCQLVGRFGRDEEVVAVAEVVEECLKGVWDKVVRGE